MECQQQKVTEKIVLNTIISKRLRGARITGGTRIKRATKPSSYQLVTIRKSE